MVRSAEPGDIDGILSISQSVSGVHFSVSQAQRACDSSDQGYRALVVAVGQELVGFLAYGCVLDEASILAVAIAEHARRAGAGSAVLLAALKEMREASLGRCLLEVRASNTAARQLYLSQGFVEDGVRKNYYVAGSQREDAVLMSIDLRVL